MTTGEQIAFKPSLAHVLAEYLHHATIRGHVFVTRFNARRGKTVRHLKHRRQPVRGSFVRPHQAEIPGALIVSEHIPEKGSQNSSRFLVDCARLRYLDSVLTEVR